MHSRMFVKSYFTSQVYDFQYLNLVGEKGELLLLYPWRITVVCCFPGATN